MPADRVLEDLLGRVFEMARHGGDAVHFEKQKWEFVFHMSDWRSDLNTLHQMYADPTQWTPESACQFLIGFLYHVVPHLNAAGRLLLGTIGDPFSRGPACSEQGDGPGSFG